MEEYRSTSQVVKRRGCLVDAKTQKRHSVEGMNLRLPCNPARLSKIFSVKSFFKLVSGELMGRFNPLAVLNLKTPYDEPQKSMLAPLKQRPARLSNVGDMQVRHRSAAK